MLIINKLLTLIPNQGNTQDFEETLIKTTTIYKIISKMLIKIIYRIILIVWITNKTHTNGFIVRTGVVEESNNDLIAPRAQKYSRFIGQQIKIEINQNAIQEEELSINHENTNLLYYDFNSSERKYRFGTNNVRLATKGEFRRTGMAGAQLMHKNVIEGAEREHIPEKRRPITSHFRVGDRLPSRASKTREKAKRIYIGDRKKQNNPQQGLIKKQVYTHESVSPKNRHIYEISETQKNERQNVHTALPTKNAMFEDLNSETTEPDSNRNFKFRDRINRKKDIIIEEEEDNEEDVEKYSQNIN